MAGSDKIKLPKDFQLYDVKDYYYWYVIKGPVPDKIFWDENIAFVKGIVMNEIAYEEWLSYQIEKEGKKHG